jgi:ribonucleoside-diphosphate reductase beta chain
MLLFERAKKYGIWNPSDIDFSKDREDWAGLKADEQDMILRLTAMFVAGEEAVTLDLLPLINVIAQEGRIEEEMYLTTFLWEEAKHVDFFSRVLTQVFDAPLDLTDFQSPSYRAIFYEALPHALHALKHDHSPAALAKASAVYNMVVEGMLAETGYHAYFTVMDRNGILPGVREGITKLKLDESRHIAYGIYLLSRLMAEQPEVWDVIQETMNDLFMPGLNIISEIFSRYDPIPFGVTQEEFMSFASSQFQKRIDRVERSRNLSLDQVAAETREIIEAEDA